VTVSRNFADVRSFQRATWGGRNRAGWLLDVDGVRGPNTNRAAAELPYLAPHFTAAELANKGAGGPLAHVRRELLAALELTRAAQGGKPLAIVSGYRTPQHNSDVGGAHDSQHVKGTAADLPHGYISLSDAVALGVWSGIGWRTVGRTRWATHLDVRHLAGHPATVRDPSTWSYD